MLQKDTDQDVSWFGRGVGKKASPLSSPPTTAQCGVKSTNGRTRETKGGRVGAAGKFRQQRLKILGKHYYKAEK